MFQQPKCMGTTEEEKTQLNKGSSGLRSPAIRIAGPINKVIAAMVEPREGERGKMTPLPPPVVLPENRIHLPSPLDLCQNFTAVFRSYQISPKRFIVDPNEKGSFYIS
jgi:hypothetical protein